ncbi:MAG: TolC family protein [Acidobacteria bacterium]|nr:TolC family protein [Acidobacteriota bacterium]
MTRLFRVILPATWSLFALVTPAAAQTGPPEAPRDTGASLAAISPASIAAGLGASPLAGGVPTGAVAPGRMRLSLHDALARGLAHNLAAVLGEQRVKSADAARWAAWSGLLPTVSASLMQATEQINLEAFGIPVAPGQSPIVGPFDISDRRLSVTQTLFSYGAIESARSGNAIKAAAAYANQDVRDQVVVVVAGMYLQLVSTQSRIEAARAQLSTAQALYDRAVALKQAGMAAGVETIRAQVQVENQRQRVIYFENEFAKQKLQLARAIGLPLRQEYDLSDRFPYAALDNLSPTEAISRAMAARADYKSAVELLKAAEFSRQAAYGSLLPTLGLAADVGNIGQQWGSALRTYSLVASISVPIFQAGRERSRILAATASLRQERAQLADLAARIEYEVRAALLDVDAAGQRVKVAQGASELAALQLTQAQDRFSAGIASHVEVVQAQEAVATASDNLISSQFAHSLAKGALARALGIAEASVERFLGGQQ